MIQLEKTFDVALVEQKLAELWSETTRGVESEAAVLRARVANLVVCVSTDALLKEVTDAMQGLTEIHPGRVLLLLADQTAADRDIEVSVACLCHTDKRTGAKRLCGEEITLTARGKYVTELPSATIPLLVSDLSTFLWWRDRVDVSDEMFRKLLAAADRLLVDSIEFNHPNELTITHELSEDDTLRNVAVSDLNWSRLTPWRSLLADFYDVPAYQQSLDQIETVRIDFVGSTGSVANATQAFLITGWLASRLGWSITAKRDDKNQMSFKFNGPNDATIAIELNATSREGRQPGKLVHVELRSHDRASFTVTLSEDNLHILSEARLTSDSRRGRLLPVRNRSAAELLAREMEILSNDRVYHEAISVVAQMLRQAV